MPWCSQETDLLGVSRFHRGKIPRNSVRAKPFVPAQRQIIGVWAESSESEHQRPGPFSRHQQGLLDCCSISVDGGGCIGRNAPMIA